MKHIRFDWAIKTILRDKANFVILEGFLTELIEEPITIDTILESESNQITEDSKLNRVDILARSTEGELLLIEVQNSTEQDYFHRMLYGASSLIIDYLNRGEAYGKIKKVYSINIVYFSLGRGDDGDDLLTGGLGNDRLYGQAGNDGFVIASDSGFDTIYDFENGTDFIELSGGLTFDDLTIAASGSSTLISLSDGSSLLKLNGMGVGLISDADFIESFSPPD